MVKSVFEELKITLLIDSATTITIDDSQGQAVTLQIVGLDFYFVDAQTNLQANMRRLAPTGSEALRIVLLHNPAR